MKTMIITGASSGIGRALAIEAQKAGFSLVVVGRNAAALHDVEARIRSAGGLCTALVRDVRESGAAQSIITTTLERYGRIDVLVNNAGMVAVGPLALQTDDALRAQWETHVLAPLQLVREALPHLQMVRGQIFMFGSGVARVPTPGLGAYPAVKAAVRAAATQLRRELHAEGIAVTYVDPGAVDTGFMERGGMTGAPKRLMATPQHVAKRLMHAVQTRPARVNAVPWQTALVGIGELLPALTDILLRAAPQIVGTQSAVPVQPIAPAPAIAAAPEIPDEPQLPDDPLDRALFPIARRMERLKLPRDFVAALLVAGNKLEPGEVAMKWAGMPNKNERAMVGEVFDALTQAGYLRKREDDTWDVLRSSP